RRARAPLSYRQRIQDDGIDTTLSLVSGGYASAGAVAARNDGFLVEDLFAGVDGTNVRGLTWATWDPEELFIALTGSRDAGLPAVGESTLSSNDTDVTEKTYAGYLQANFDTEMFGVPARGNFGIRGVRTEITSIGISSDLATSPGPSPDTITITEVGEPTINVETNAFWNWLPSANLILELSDDKLLRLAAYRAIARPDAFSMSAALTFDDEADLGDLGSIISAAGNPFLEPLASWNADVSFEWYASRTSSFSFAAYAKQLQTGVETDVVPLTIVVDGAPQEVIVGRSVNSNDKSHLLGFEIAAQHTFDFGLGFQASYNFADSNFEFEDPVVVSGLALADFTDPANIVGFSRHTGNATVFYETENFNARVAYKIRSGYFKPFRSASNRFTRTQDFLDFSTALDLTDNLQVRFQVLNILDEPNIFSRPTLDGVAQADYSGRRYFLGLRGRF
ncbi:MAG: TonB-dependent receptor, partial [Pseudomonadota bacterium]